MKNVIHVSIFALCLFTSSAKASSAFTCQSQDQTVFLEVGDPRVEIGSYNECNGGVGDEMTNCQPHSYEIVVRDAVLKIGIKEGELSGQAKLISSNSRFNGFTIVTYQDVALHIDIDIGVNVNGLSPVISMRIMGRGTPGKPIGVGNYTMPCRPLP